MNSNSDALIAEVKSDLRKMADAHLLDEDSMYRDIITGIKKFGNDVMEMHETVIEVEDGFAVLPDNFFSLYLAALCEPIGYSNECESEVEFHNLQDSNFYKEKIIHSSKWNECDSNCCAVTEEKVIRENFYYKNKKALEFYYQNPQLLKLGRTFNKNSCHDKCRNYLVKDNPNEIVISKLRLQANFNDGDVYLQYFGLPLDGEGNIDFPESKNGHLEEYLEYRLKRKIAERAIGNKEAEGISNLYKSYFQQEKESLREASSELKMGNLDPERLRRRIKRLNRLESLQFESAFTRMYS
jgi:hypothetical protein